MLRWCQLDRELALNYNRFTQSPLFTCVALRKDMELHRLILYGLLLVGGAAQAQAQNDLPLAAGPFKPTMESLKQYRCPDWFRDAKFGIWAHWGPQSVPMDGDWYARGIYEQGSEHYKYHLAHYGHPSEFGYKDIIPLWKAEKWDPDRLMKLYKQAGAKYFVSMGSHHDDFFLWNSKLHRWNAVNMGPHRDVVGDWQKAAKKYGLRFGVSEHLGASFNWFQVSHGSDKTGPKAGVPYDGANPEYQDLYHFPGAPSDRGWYSTNPHWQQQWYNEIKELVDNYHPDLLYSDGGVPFGNEVGLSMIAHLYNSNAALHGGKVEAVYNCKQVSEGRWVEDLERGIMPRIDPNPWQTDTSIGDWFYNRNWKFRPVTWVIHTLVDNVSKNGNLLLNVVQRPDGSIDPEVEQMLRQLAEWNAIHGEAIYASRPWLVYGEGTVRAKGGSFKEDYTYSARDIRFTTHGATLYALALGWPDDNQLTIRSLAQPAGEKINRIESVQLLGYKGKIAWKQTAEGLTVFLPAQKTSIYTTGLKIIGRNLKPVPIPEVVPVEKQDAAGVLTLSAENATLHGSQIQVETKGGKPNIGFWDRADEWASWKARIGTPGRFHVRINVAAMAEGSHFVIEIGDQKLACVAPNTGAWDAFQVLDVGDVTVPQAGELEINVRPQDAATWKAINLNAVTLTPQTN
jgi:alpha-L-fucosidase